VQAVLPLTSFFAVITFITSQGTFSRLSMTDVLKLVFMGINIILPILTYIEIKKLSLRSYYLNIALLCFEPARYLVMVAAQGGAISMSTHIYYLIWTTLNLMYFKNRKPLFAEETSYIDAGKPEAEPEPGKGVPPPETAPVAAARTAPAKARRVLTKQEMRDRNITWVLIIGVIFVLTAGVIFATSNWSIFSSAVKTTLVALVAVVFFGTSIFSEKKLKIPKTAIAFWSLGALFVPVMVFSAGYFMLFGEWLSVFGEGRFILGVIGATASAAIFAVSTAKYKNRLFSWLTLAECSIDAAFIIAAFKPSLDVFYLGIVFCNWIVVIGYTAVASPEKLKMFPSIKLPEKLKIFIPEMQLFIPVNLVISSVFMLGFYEDPVMHGFNIILISLVYVFMVFTGWQKECSYPFIALLIYGIYLVIENTRLSAAAFIIYALIGFIFAGIEYFAKSREPVRQIFANASGVSALLAFIYINFRWTTELERAASLIILASFLLITLNYFYLSYRTKNIVFTYAVPVTLLASGYQGYLLIRLAFGSYLLSSHAFLVSAIMFGALYYYNRWEYTQAVSRSCSIASLAAMLGAYLLALNEGSYKTAVLILLVFAVLLYLMSGRVSADYLKLWIKRAVPAVLALDILTIYEVIAPYAANSGAHWYSMQVHFGLTAVAVYIISIALRRFDKLLAFNAFWISHALIPAAAVVLARDYHDFPPLFLIPMLICFYSIRMTIADKGNKFQPIGFLLRLSLQEHCRYIPQRRQHSLHRTCTSMSSLSPLPGDSFWHQRLSSRLQISQY